jgi:hypothetical protein
MFRPTPKLFLLIEECLDYLFWADAPIYIASSEIVLDLIDSAFWPEKVFCIG